MKNPLVTIYLTTYNDLFFLKQCLKSIAQQTYKNIEIIVADDCSVDGTDYYINKVKIKFSRLKYFKSAVNVGTVLIPGEFIHHAEGELITILQSDDYYLTDNFIEEAVSHFVSNDGITLFYSAVRLNYYGTRRYGYWGLNSDRRFCKGGEVTRHMIRYGMWPSAMVARTEAFRQVGGFRAEIGIGQDVYCAAALSSKGETYYSATVHVNARIHKRSLTGALGMANLSKALRPTAIRIGQDIFDGSLEFKDLIDENIIDMEAEKYFPRNYLKVKINSLVRLINSKSRILIYGSGRHTDGLFSKTNIKKMNIKFFADSDPCMRGKLYESLPIVGPAEIGPLIEKDLIDLVIISSRAFENEIYNTLINLGICGDAIIRLYSSPMCIDPNFQELVVNN